MPQTQFKALLKRGAGSGGTFILNGNPIGIPDREFRHVTFDHIDPQAPTKEKLFRTEKLDFKALIEQVQGGDTSIPTQTTSEEKNIRKTHHLPLYSDGSKSSKSPEAYDPEVPLLSLEDLLSKIRASSNRRSNREATALYKHNPHLLEHMLSGAPYTISFCTRCAPYRKCRLHREVLQEMTSVSLCDHKRMNLYWQINDPSNQKCSWKLEIKDYTIGDAELVPEHRGCRVHRPSERVPVLAERLIEDLRREDSRTRECPRRRNVRRTEDEIYALLGAWEFAAREKLEREERKRENEKKAREQLAETLKLVQKMEQEKKCKLSEVEEGEIVEVAKEVRIDSPFTCTPTPESKAHDAAEPAIQQVPHSSLPVVVITPPTSASNKRKRSLEHTPELPARMAKKVRFLPEIEASPIEERRRMHSPPHIADRGELSPTASKSSYTFEDEVDYDDDDLEELGR